jgi:hypothetical protein
MPIEDFFGTTYVFPNYKLYVRDRVAGTTTAVIPVTAASEGTLPVVSADGAVVAFQSVSGILAAGDTNERSDIFIAPNPAIPSPTIVTFTAWAAGHPGAEDPDADNDHDGLKNFAEYALGLDPFRPDAAEASSITFASPPGGGSVPTFTFTFDTLADAVVTAMTSADLVTWSPVRASDATYSGTDLPDGFQEATVYWTGPLASRRFFRLELSPR